MSTTLQSSPARVIEVPTLNFPLAGSAAISSMRRSALGRLWLSARDGTKVELSRAASGIAAAAALAPTVRSQQPAPALPSLVNDEAMPLEEVMKVKPVLAGLGQPSLPCVQSKEKAA